METNQLIHLLLKDKYAKKSFCGVLPIDQLPQKPVKKPCSFIVNTHNSNLPGEHWFAIFVPHRGKIEYFDSYCKKPINNEVYNFLRINGIKYIYNKTCIQSNLSVNCGKFCLHYIYFRSRNYSMKKYVKFFSSNKLYNDMIINKLYKKYS